MVNSGVTASISGLTIENGQKLYQHGNVNGGGIDNSGTLTLSNVAITGNSTNGSQGGGGIYNNGSLTMSNSTVSNNAGYDGYSGAGIRNSGQMTLTNAPSPTIRQPLAAASSTAAR